MGKDYNNSQVESTKKARAEKPKERIKVTRLTCKIKKRYLYREKKQPSPSTLFLGYFPSSERIKERNTG